MRAVLTFALCLSLCPLVWSSDEDIQYTREAIERLKSDLSAAEQSELISLQAIAERQEELIEARILLAELEHKRDEVTPLLEELVTHWSKAEKRQTDLFQAGVISQTSLVSVQRQSLATQVRLAQHSGDRAALRKLSTKWRHLEIQQLEQIQDLVKAGAASSTELARQKMRIARAARVAEL